MRNYNTLKPEQIKLKPLPPDCVEYVHHNRNPDELGYVLVHGCVHRPSWGTFVSIRHKPTGNVLGVGESLCGVHDEPNKRVGYRIAHNRAVKNALKNLRTGVVELPAPTDEYVTADTFREAGVL